MMKFLLYFIVCLSLETKLTISCPVACKCHFNVVSCDDANLENSDLINITQYLPIDTVTLYLQNNNLEDFSLEVFEKFSNLYEIYFRGNRLTRMPNNTLFYLKKLRKLSIDENAITQLQENDLIGYENLEELDLGGNRINNIPINIFRKFQNLRLLALQYNKIEEIHKESFNGLRNLMSLNVMENKILKLHEGCFDQLKSVEQIYLNRNFLKKIPNHLFSYLPRIDSIDLSLNELKNISKYAFADMSNIKPVAIVLDGNEITTLSSSSFKQSKRLKISIFRNILLCDCQLLYNYHDLTKSEREISISGAVCVSPRNLFDTMVSSVNTSVLKCNPCDFHQCQNDGICQNINTQQAICKCIEEFKGDFCENVKINPTTPRTEENLCVEYPCENGGTCIKINRTMYACECKAKYYGGFCEKYRSNGDDNVIMSLAKWIAIGVCGVLVIIVGLCLAIFLCRRKRRQNNNHLVYSMEENKILDYSKDEELSSIYTYSTSKKESL